MEYSALMSVYCKEDPRNLREAICSIINQTIRPSDFVIVCDGPLTSELYVVIDEFCNKYPSLFNVIKINENCGVGPALKIGVEACKYEYIARMDADDIALPNRIEKQLKILRETLDISVVGGQILEFEGEPDQKIRYRIVPQKHAEIAHRLKRANPMNHVTVVFKKSDVVDAGNYPDHSGFEDYHLWAKMICEGYKFYNIDSVCCKVRADGEMMKRRSGFSYFLSALDMQKYLLSENIISAWQFLGNVAIRFGAAVVLSGKLRKNVFLKLMRKQRL